MFKSIKSNGRRVSVYVICFVVFILSFLVSPYLAQNDLIKRLSQIPGILSLLGILWQLLKEERAHERAIELQNKQQDFVLGTASHMANVAYDKHALFCEEYLKRVHEGLSELVRNGPTDAMIKFGHELFNIRLKYSAWLTTKIEGKLMPFEDALKKMGANKNILESMPTGETRTKVVSELYRLVGLVFGNEKPSSESETGLAIDSIVTETRRILGVELLTDLRIKTAELAIERLGK